MNKIIVNRSEFELKDTNVLLTDFLEKNIDLHIYGNVCCGILKIPNDFVLTIYLHDYASLTLDILTHLNDTHNTIKIHTAYQAELNLDYACTFEGKNYLTICNYVESNETKTNIFVRAVEENGSLEIKAEGVILENTHSNVYLEDIKALTNQNNSVKVQPNLIVKTNSVVANHNATISNIDKQELFYLESKGLSLESATKLIKSGFLKGILKIEKLKTGGEIENE